MPMAQRSHCALSRASLLVPRAGSKPPMPRYRLGTLLILLALLPPILAWWVWPAAQRILWPPKPEQIDIEIVLIENVIDLQLLFGETVSPDKN